MIAGARLRDARLWLLFVVSLAAAVFSGLVFDGWQKRVATYAGLAVSLLTGITLARRPRIAALLEATPTLWFLFLFNGGVAAILLGLIRGLPGYEGGAFMTVISLSSGIQLLLRRRETADGPSF